MLIKRRRRLEDAQVDGSGMDHAEPLTKKVKMGVDDVAEDVRIGEPMQVSPAKASPRASSRSPSPQRQVARSSRSPERSDAARQASPSRSQSPAKPSADSPMNFHQESTGLSNMPHSHMEANPAAEMTTNTQYQPRPFQRFGQDILRALKRHRDAGPFLAPVDPVALGIPQYFDVVKNPMDVSTVEKKLNEGAYGSLDDFVADVRLVFENCFIFNPPDHVVYKMGKSLEKYFNTHLKKYLQVCSCHFFTRFIIFAGSHDCQHLEWRKIESVWSVSDERP